MRRTQHVGVGGVGFLNRHLVVKAAGNHKLRHLMTATQLVDEVGIQPRLVDLQLGVGQQAITIETFDIVAFIGATVPQMFTPSSFMAATSIVPVTARPSGVVLK